jgi:hypothetical protein
VLSKVKSVNAAYLAVREILLKTPGSGDIGLQITRF